MFTVFFLISLTLLAWGLTAPHHFAKHAKNHKFDRKHAGIGFGIFACLFLVLAVVTSSQQPAQLQQAGYKSTPEQMSPQQSPDTITQQETETEAVPYTTVNQNDSGLPRGETRVVQVGENGVETLTYNVTYTNGEQTDKTLASDAMTLQPVSQIVDVGTYVMPTPQPSCSNGTYTNSAGNIVCRPESASSAPAGATAKCVDGTYSFSQSHSGTCSHHGGVAEWL